MDIISEYQSKSDRRQILSHRLAFPQQERKFASDTVAQAYAIVRKKINSGEYKFIQTYCFCGGGNEILISEIDRYGFYYPVVLCMRCGILRSNFMLDEHAARDFYSKYYRNLYGEGDQSIHELYAYRRHYGEEIANKILGKITLNKGAVVFEIGCDFGTVLEAFDRRGYSCYGCDFGTEHIAYARERSSTISLFNGGQELLSAVSVKADLVILHHVLEHFSSLEESLLEIRSLLKPNGILYIALPGLYAKVSNCIFKNTDILPLFQNAHVYQFTLDTLRYVSECCGFSYLCGDESIEAYFIKNNKASRSKTDYSRATARKIYKYLRRAECVNSIKRRLKKIVPQSLQQYVKKLIRERIMI